MRTMRGWSKLLMFLWCLDTLLMRLVIANDLDPQAVWRTSRYCGANSLYMYLKINGVKVNYDEIAGELNVSEQGSSFVEIKNMATNKGLRSAILRPSPDELAKSRFPLIALMDLPGTSTGHYVVLLACGKQSVTYVDGTTAAVRDQPRDEFVRQWSGFVLAQADGLSFWGRMGVIASCMSVAGLLWFRDAVKNLIGRNNKETIAVFLGATGPKPDHQV